MPSCRAPFLWKQKEIHTVCQLPRPVKGSGLVGPCPIQFPGFVSRPSGPNVSLPDCAFACVPRYRGLRIHRRVIDSTRFFILPGYTRREHVILSCVSRIWGVCHQTRTACREAGCSSHPRGHHLTGTHSSRIGTHAVRGYGFPFGPARISDTFGRCSPGIP